MDISVDAWDLRQLLLSLDDRPRHRSDRSDLEGVVVRAVATLSSLPRRPITRSPNDMLVLPGPGTTTTIGRERSSQVTAPVAVVPAVVPAAVVAA